MVNRPGDWSRSFRWSNTPQTRSSPSILPKSAYNVPSQRSRPAVSSMSTSSSGSIGFAHLETNLSIDRGDFDALPIFDQEGGWGRADRVFGGKLADVLIDINEALAA